MKIKALLLNIFLALTFSYISAIAQGYIESKGKYSVAGLDDDRDVEQFFISFKKAIAENDKDKVASMITFPVKAILANGLMVTLKSRADFIKAYDKVFDTKFKQIILQTQVEDLWAKYSGVAMPRGEIWINGVTRGKKNLEKFQIKITTINNVIYRAKSANARKR